MNDHDVLHPAPEAEDDPGVTLLAASNCYGYALGFTGVSPDIVEVLSAVREHLIRGFDDSRVDAAKQFKFKQQRNT